MAFRSRAHRRPGRAGADPPEPLALLLLPARLEDFSLRAPAAELLEIPQAIALEPPALVPRGAWAHAIAARQARRLRLPGEPRALVLYHPGQYPLARALLARHPRAELWYVRPAETALAGAKSGDRRRRELSELDDLAAQRAHAVLAAEVEAHATLRVRLVELGVVSPRPFAPGARVRAR